MVLSEIIKLAQKENKAFRTKGMSEYKCYCYHGIDNVVWMYNPTTSTSDRGQVIHLSIADLTNDDWELDNEHPYHGPLNSYRIIAGY